MSTLAKVLIIILVVLVALVVVLYFVGKKMQKKQAEQEAQIEAAKQTVTMLIIDKKADIRTLSHLGASEQLIRKIFLLEGLLVNLLGAIGGIVIGLTICLLQEHFGLLKLGNGSEYIISAYPVAVQVWDIVLVIGIVFVLSLLSVWIPTRNITIEK